MRTLITEKLELHRQKHEQKADYLSVAQISLVLYQLFHPFI